MVKRASSNVIVMVGRLGSGTVLRAWLIRHGESESNAGAPSADPGASVLTAVGREQARRVAATLPEPPALIVVSPFVRAAQTAQATIDRFPDAPREEWAVQEFTYLGDFHHRTTTSAERRPVAVEYWRRADPHLTIGGAESFADLIGRANALVAGLARQPAGPVAVFTHGTFMRAVVWTLLTGGPVDHEGMLAFQRFADGIAVPNGAVIGLRFPDGAAPQVLLGSAW
jgi:2,3-bisphosphoglycerate-dependent phosphoglycerate mutase